MHEPVEFTVLFVGGGEVTVTCNPYEIDIVLAEQFPYENIDMTYRKATEFESFCSGTLTEHSDSWWEGFACRNCGQP